MDPSLTRDEQEIVDRFRELWWSRNETTFFANTWLGVPAFQHPFDAWVTQEIICEVQPERIVESGSFAGGSALLWATILEHVEPSGRVIAIDPLPCPPHQDPLFVRRVDWINGSSIAPDVIADVARRCRGQRTLVVLDSDHAADHVEAELDAYADVVSPESYLIVQDGFVSAVDPQHGPGPREAVERFLRRDDRFEIDETRERMMFTFNPCGFLRRKS